MFVVPKMSSPNALLDGLFFPFKMHIYAFKRSQSYLCFLSEAQDLNAATGVSAAQSFIVESLIAQTV